MGDVAISSISGTPTVPASAQQSRAWAVANRVGLGCGHLSWAEGVNGVHVLRGVIVVYRAAWFAAVDNMEMEMCGRTL